jgi:hypothetical protein
MCCSTGSTLPWRFGHGGEAASLLVTARMRSRPSMPSWSGTTKRASYEPQAINERHSI